MAGATWCYSGNAFHAIQLRLRSPCGLGWSTAIKSLQSGQKLRIVGSCPFLPIQPCEKLCGEMECTTDVIFTTKNCDLIRSESTCDVILTTKNEDALMSKNVQKCRYNRAKNLWWKGMHYRSFKPVVESPPWQTVTLVMKRWFWFLRPANFRYPETSIPYELNSS